MKVSLRWLAEHVDLRLPVEDIASRLTMSGNEVSGIVRTGDWDERVTVGAVVDVAPHPNADRLRLATVDTGGGQETVVCGAPNVAPGQKVAYAAVGAELFDGHSGKRSSLKAATIRGVESRGMLCSERELGISDRHDGILVLPDEAPIGAPLSQVLGDVILDIDVTPNRPDCMSVVGIAREVAALTNATFREMPPTEYEETGRAIKERASVQIADRDLCPRYLAALVDDVRVGPSPPWMQERLTACGVRPINNVVDVTNYVMLELGQPLHAFDFAQLRGRAIVVRSARPGERLTTLDGKEHVLEDDMLLICDAERPLALAGIMGGLESEVTEATTSVLIESANFAPTAIRRASSRLRLRTEASARFEKGLHPQLAEVAILRAAALMTEVCGGRAARGIIDVYPGKQRDHRVTLMEERLHRVLGIILQRGQVRGILTSLGFSCRWVPPDRYVVRVPYWRTDVRIQDDVIEEVARILGYDALPTTPLAGRLPEPYPAGVRQVRERLRDEFAAAGMQEIITYSMIGADLMSRALPFEDIVLSPPLRLANPLSAEHEYARTSLRPGVLRTLAENAAGGRGLVALFEVGRVYHARADDLPEETEVLCGAVTGRLPDRWGLPSGQPADFWVAKGYVEGAFERLGLSLRFAADELPGLLPGRSAVIDGGMERLGVLGELDPSIAAAFDFRGGVYLFEIDVGAVARALERHPRRYQPISRYPAVEEDLSFLVDAACPAGDLAAEIEAAPLVERAAVFDVYTGEGLPAGKKSIAFSVTYRAPDRTLTNDDIGRTRRRLVERLAREFGAELRGGP